MPGVQVTTATRSGPNSPLRLPSGQFFAVGITERGSTTSPVLLRGMADVDRYLGKRVTYGALWDQLKAFFDEGGLQAYVARVVGPAATVGTLTLQDRAGTPVNTLRIDAQNAGAWSSTMKIEVRNGSAPNTFRIVVTLNDEVVEDLNNLTSPGDAATKFAASPYVKVVDLGSATAAPNNNPAVLAATAVSAGSDDRASVTSTHYLAALAKFSPGLGDGCVAIPGQTGSTVWEGIVAHCEQNRRIGLLAPIQNESISNLKTQAASLDSEFVGLFAPWIVVSDGGTGQRTISPEGYVAACRARAHEAVGPWRAPAGALGKANSVLNVGTDYTAAEANELDDAKVSVIRRISNSIRLYGWRSLSNDTINYTFLKDRDMLNRLVIEAEDALEDFVFEPVDAKRQLLSSINGAVVGIVEPYRQAGGIHERYDELTGALLDPGYKVETGSEVNTAATLGNNEVRARLQVRVAPLGNLIGLTIVKVGVLSGL